MSAEDCTPKRRRSFAEALAAEPGFETVAPPIRMLQRPRSRRPYHIPPLATDDPEAPIGIDRDLIENAQKVSGLATKKAVIEEGLRLLVQMRMQEDVLRLAGRVTWRGDLDASREGRPEDVP